MLSRILDVTWLKQTKYTLEQQYMLFFLHSQYHARWYTGDIRSHDLLQRWFM